MKLLQLFKKDKIVLFIILGLICGYIFFWNYLPPYTPLKKLRVNTNLNISSIEDVIYYYDDCSFTGNCFLEIVVKLDINETKYLSKECLKENFIITQKSFSKGDFLYDYISCSDKILIKEEKHKNLIIKTILNKSRNIFIYVKYIL